MYLKLRKYSEILDFSPERIHQKWLFVKAITSHNYYYSKLQ